jgi:enoyl-CoA hydratase/carnithine racemase
MDNPPVNTPVNTQNAELQDELIRAFDRLSNPDEVRVAMLTGKGKYFCAGVDIKAHAGLQRGPGDSWRGMCLGAALAVATSCDILLAGESALVGLPEIDVGPMGSGRLAMHLFGHSPMRRAQHHRGGDRARRLPLRAEHDGGPADHGGLERCDARLHREAQAGVQGTLKGLYLTL